MTDSELTNLSSRCRGLEPCLARGLCKLRTIEAVKQADFLRVPRPKLLQPWRERIELLLSRRYVVQVLKQLHRGGVVGLTFGGDKCFDLTP